MILLKNYLTNSSVCCVIFYYSRSFITIKNLELSYKINNISPSLSIYLPYPTPALQNAVAIFTCGSAIWYIIYLLPPSLRDHQPNGSRYILIICKNVSAYMLKTNNKILEQIQYLYSYDSYDSNHQQY